MKKKVKKVKKFNSSKTKVFEENDYHFCFDTSVCHTIDPCNYYLYQTPHTIKIHVIIPGIEYVSKSKIKIKFKESYFELSIYDLAHSNYHLQFGQLSYQIIPSMCKYFIRKDKIIIEIAKEIPRVWRSIGEAVQRGFWLAKFVQFLQDIPEVTYVGGEKRINGITRQQNLTNGSQKKERKEIEREKRIKGVTRQQNLTNGTQKKERKEIERYGDNLWDELIKLKDIEFDYLSPPVKLHRYVPALRDEPPFKSLEEALRFYKNELKKDCFNEALFVLYGFTLMKKMRVDRFFRNPDNPESIEESMFMSRKFLQKCKNSDKVDNETLVEILKAEGNSFYKTGRFYAALQMYLEALKLSPESASLYSNTSAAYFMLGLYHEALNMAQKSVQFDSSFRKGYLRIGKCNLILGNTKGALKAYTKARELVKNKEVEAEIMKVHKLQDYIKEAKLASDCEDYFLADDCYYNAHCIAHANTSLLLLYTEYRIKCNKQSFVETKVKSRREQNPNDPYSYLMLGMVDYYGDNKEGALTQFEKALKSSKNDPQINHCIKRATDLYNKRERGNEALKKDNNEEALKHYSAALLVDPGNKLVNAKLYYNIALIHTLQNNIDEAIASLTKAINLKCYNEQAYAKRSVLYKRKKLYSKAVQDLKRIDFEYPSESSKKRLEEAQSLLNKKYKKNYYQILNVSPTATAEEIKKSYDKLASFHHPDNIEGGDDQPFFEKMYKDITEAYSILKDAVKKEKYDKENDTSYEDEEDDEDDVEELEFRRFLFDQFIEDRTANVSCLLGTTDDSSDEDYDDLSDEEEDDDDDDDDYDEDDECYCASASEESIPDSV